MREYPCKDCKDRYLGCHDRCARYQAAKNQNMEERQGITRKRFETGAAGFDYTGHDRRMRGKYHGKVLKSPKR